MKKKLLLSALVLGAAVAIGYLLKPSTEEVLGKVWRNNNIVANFADINEPEAKQPDSSEIYIDASGSMKPYFHNGTEMINSISEIKNLNIDGTKVYLIGNPVPYNGLITNIISSINASPSNATTTFDDFFKAQAAKIDTVNTLVYLVTDGIMSLGKTGDIAKALTDFRGRITAALSGHSNLAVAVFRYIGDFNGKYFDKNDSPIRFNGDRPYFIIALGQKEAIKWLQQQPPEKLNGPERLFLGLHDFKGHYKSHLALEDPKDPTKVFPLEKMGEPVNLTLDLPPCLEHLDASQAKLENKGNKLSVTITKEGKSFKATIGKDIVLLPEQDGNIKITMTFPNSVPENWLLQWNCDADNENPASPTTFGLKTLISAMFNALEPDSELLKADFIYKPK